MGVSGASNRAGWCAFHCPAGSIGIHVAGSMCSSQIGSTPASATGAPQDGEIPKFWYTSGGPCSWRAGGLQPGSPSGTGDSPLGREFDRSVKFANGCYCTLTANSCVPAGSRLFGGWEYSGRGGDGPLSGLSELYTHSSQINHSRHSGHECRALMRHLLARRPPRPLPLPSRPVGRPVGRAQRGNAPERAGLPVTTTRLAR